MKLTKENVPFTMVANEVLNDPNISLKAKGLYSYLFSKPDGWDFSADRIQNECKEERKAVLRTLKELEEAGLLARNKKPSGRVDYFLKYARSDSEPKSQNGTETKRHGGEVGRISKKDSNSKKDIDSNTLATQGVAAKDVQECIDLFKEVNPTHDRLFANTTQRAAIERLLKRFGREKVENMIRALPHIIVQKAAPRITTPYMLEVKLGELIAFVKQNESAPSGRGKEIIGLEKLQTA